MKGGEKMTKIIDLMGKKFGRLMVIRRIGSDKYGKPMWLCKCDCGNEKIVQGGCLKRGNTKSCGCSRKGNTNRKLPLGLSSMRSRINSYKIKAKIRNLEWKITEEQFEEITQRDCFYCGTKPNNIANIKKCNGSFTYNGLDRVDNAKGYTIDNVVSCCKTYNYAKNNHTIQEFKDWSERLYNNLPSWG